MTQFFNLDLQRRWETFSIYEKFEHLIISLLTIVIAAIVGAATWQLILHTFDLLRGHLLDPRDAQVFQAVFGMVLTVLIAMEFKHSLLIVLHQQRDIVQIPSVVLIALLAMVRKFIILDIYQTQPAVVFALAAASLSLGIVFWLVRNQEDTSSANRRQYPGRTNGLIRSYSPIDCGLPRRHAPGGALNSPFSPLPGCLGSRP